MKEKKPCLIVTFYTTAAAMEMERRCRAQGVPGRLMPTPRALSADCGICWCAAPEDRAAVERAAAGLETEHIAELAARA